MTTLDSVPVPVAPGLRPAAGWRDVEVPTAREILDWPVTVSVAEAGRCWHLGRDSSYELARLGEFPVPVLRLGRRLVVTRASILTALGIDD